MRPNRLGVGLTNPADELIHLVLGVLERRRL
ncbi:hypothetical protein BH23GEM7_BH23GEM7_08280 [soil metagenome]